MWFMVPYITIINLLVFGNCFFSSLKSFLLSFIVALFYFATIYAVFGFVALIIKKRFPADGHLFKRVGIMLPVFYAMNLLSVQGLYFIYEKTTISGCIPQREMIWWVVGFACLSSTIITLVNEAAVGWEKWKSSITETGRLQGAYHKSRLLGLKRQINPHFLFNCFNTLSCLINEDEEKAEDFLNEMTKVYRYLLKSDEEQIVTLEEELKFIQAYLYLNKIRFGTALSVNIQIAEAEKQKGLPPLSLQVVLENIIYRNAFSKSDPIVIDITTNNKNGLVIRNTIQHKLPSKEIADYEEALDHLVNKYRLLNMPDVEVEETGKYRTITLPLKEKEEVAA